MKEIFLIVADMDIDNSYTYFALTTTMQALK